MLSGATAESTVLIAGDVETDDGGAGCVHATARAQVTMSVFVRMYEYPLMTAVYRTVNPI